MLKTETLGHAQSSYGSLFHSLGAAQLNALSPKVTNLLRGCFSCSLSDERKDLDGT